MIFFDAGHGGVINGIYQTKGKRAFINGEWFYEGEYNRLVVNKLKKLCVDYNIDFFDVLAGSNKDIYLNKRVKTANYYGKKTDLYISIHADAFSKESANGFTIFRYKNSSKGISKIFNENYFESNPDIRNRGMKEANFFVLRKTKMNAILIEMGFMTNRENNKYLRSNIDDVVEGIFNGILEYTK